MKRDIESRPEAMPLGLWNFALYSTYVYSMKSEGDTLLIERMPGRKEG
jgi:hypothetical protein